MRWREDLQSSFESGCDQIGGFVAGDEKSSVLYVVLDLSFGSELGWWRVLLEDDEKWSKGITVVSLVCGEDRMYRWHLQQGNTKGDTEPASEDEFVLNHPVQPPDSTVP